MRKMILLLTVVASLCFLLLPDSDAEAGKGSEIQTVSWTPGQGVGSARADSVRVTGNGLKKIRSWTVWTPDGTQLGGRLARWNCSPWTNTLMVVQSGRLESGEHRIEFTERNGNTHVVTLMVQGSFTESDAYADLMAEFEGLRTEIDGLKSQVAALQANATKYQFVGYGRQRLVRGSDGSTPAEFQDGVEDPEAVFDGSRFTVQVDGHYFLHAAGRYYLPQTDGSSAILQLVVNGAEVEAAAVRIDRGGEVAQNVSTLVFLRAGDQVEVRQRINGTQMYVVDDRFFGYLISR